MPPTYILEPISAGTSEIQVPADGRASVGREATNKFAFPHDLQMSSVHFDVGGELGGCRIRDLGSSNGLFLNTKRIKTAIVVEGDEIRAGGSRWRLVARRIEVPTSAPEPGQALPPEVSTPRTSPLTTSSAWPVKIQDEVQAAAAELLLTASDGSCRRLAGSQSLIIGRTTAAQWVFDDEQMSSCHMNVSQESGVWKVTDLDSSNGTFVNGSRVNEVQLFSGDDLRGGQTHFEVALVKGALEQSTPLPAGLPVAAEVVLDKVIARPVRSPAEDRAVRPTEATRDAGTSHAILRRLSDGQEFDLAPHQIASLGRSPQSLIPLASDYEVSTQHATLLFDGSTIRLRDVGSSNGTFVGGKRITETELTHGDRLRVGKTELLVCLLPQEGKGPSPAAQPLQDQASTDVGAELPYYSNSESDYRPMAQAPDGRSDRIESEEVTSTDSDLRSEVVSRLAYDSGRANDGFTERGSESSPAEQFSTDIADAAAETSPGLPLQPNERQSPIAMSEGASVRRIDFDDKDSYARKAEDLKAVACRSGLSVYLGEASTLQPVDVCLRLLRATSGWVLNGSEIENWIEAAGQGLGGLPREWLNPSLADDVSWMLPFLGNWGSGNSWLVLSHAELEDGLHSLRNLRQSAEGHSALLTSLTPTTLAEFLTQRESSVVEPFFAPLDAILLEVGAGERWALVGRSELEAILQSGDF